MSNSPPSPGPDLFFAAGECLTRFGVWVRRTDVDLEEATREEFTRNSDADAIGRDGIIRTWEIDKARAEWLNEVDLDATRNLLIGTNMIGPNWGEQNLLEPIEAVGDGLFLLTDESVVNGGAAAADAVSTSIFVPTTITASVKIRKKPGGTTVNLRLSFDGQHGVLVDPGTGAFAAEGSPDSVRVTDLGSFFLAEITRTSTTDTFTLRIFPAWAPSGDLGTQQFIEGSTRVRDAQVEVGTEATAFQETPRDLDRKFSR